MSFFNKESRYRLLKVCIWIPVIIMYACIFGFSGQNGEESQGLSWKVGELVVDFADSVHIINVDEFNREDYIEKVQLPVRKCAHMTEYAILGLLVLLALSIDCLKEKYRNVSALLITTCFASTDEFHQLFVPGRSGKALDVIIDMAGCAIGLIICLCVRKIISKYRKNKVAN